MRRQRTILALGILVAVVSVLAGVARGQGQGSGDTDSKRFTISGSVGVARVRMQGLPASPVTSDAGTYSVEVPQGWAGTVMPAKEGFTFDPRQRVYAAIERSQDNQDYTARVLTYRIMGNVGLEGVVMRGLPGDPLTDARGYYVATLNYGWSGVVTPTKRGCEFEPPARRYSAVNADMQGQDYEVVSLKAATPPSLGSVSSEVLVIPTSEVEATEVVEIEEDMRVMLEILREPLRRPRSRLGWPIDYGDFFGGERYEAIYVEDYGVLFVIRGEFPFSFSGGAPAAEAREGEVDPVWQRARQRLYAPGAEGRYGRAGGAAAAEMMTFAEFKADLVAALRHAANIRHVGPAKAIVLTVIGQDEGDLYFYRGSRGVYGGGHGGGSRSVSGGSFGPEGGSTYAHSETYSTRGGSVQRPASDGYGNMKRDALGRVIYGARPVPGSPTVLTMRTTKADVDAYAAGEINLEEFRSRVEVLSY